MFCPPACPRARGALPPLRQTPEAPQPLWGQTQIVPGPAARPVTLGTKLNRLTSPGRCVATGVDSPSRGPRPGAEVSVARDTAGRGGAGAVLAAPRPSGRAPGPAPEPCPRPPAPQPPAPAEGGRAQARKRRRLASGGLSATPGQPAFVSRTEAFVCRHPVSLPQFSVPGSFLTRPQPGLLLWQRGAGGRTGAFSFPSPPGRPGNLCLAWPPALGEETRGPAHATLLPSLVRSSTPVPSPGVCAVPFTSLPWLQCDQATSG